MDWRAFGRGDFARDYGRLIDEYRALDPAPRVLLWTPLAPLFEGHAFHDDPILAEIDAAIAAVADGTKCETIDLRAPLAKHPEWFAADRIHPNAAGAAEIARTVAAAIR